MNKEEFNLLNIEEQINAFNQLIKSEGSVTKSCERLTLSRSTIRNRFKSIGYSFCKECNKYTKDNEHDCNATVIQAQEEHKENTSVFFNADMKEKFKWMMSNFNVLEDIINERIHNEYICNTDIIEVKSTEFTIDLPEAPNHHTTIRINKEIWDKFNDIYNSKYKHLNKIDVLSMAIKQFNEKHK